MCVFLLFCLSERCGSYPNKPDWTGKLIEFGEATGDISWFDDIANISVG